MTNRIGFKISEDNYLGDAQFVVKVDGIQIGDVLTATAAHALGDTEEFFFFGDFSSAHRVSVTFLNDLYTGPGQDRDLYVDSFTFDDHTQLGADAFSNTGLPVATSANLYRANDTATYDVSQYTAGSAEQHQNAVYRLYDGISGDHLFTTSENELHQVLKNLPSYHLEGVVGSTPDIGPGTEDVFRFFNTVTGDHFLTTSTAERDQVLKALPDYHYEGVAFQAYVDPNAVGSGGETMERFFNTKAGVHMYTSDANEIKMINAGQEGPGWIDEGKAFTIHVAAEGLLHA
ncbi:MULTISPECIES: carbohydrate-binding domain-containing protein [Methylobacterium]|uniref:Carbohydrate binding module xylan-binding domain-containing protein n=1 Tax=Methylobacterium thuringiense TaxID=1003091 RepID=A0ABQ4TIN2_9HYPH|nr:MULTISPECIES: carbohydrate-binding domain-containing protein [Methylobacterium]GJE53693.1 hypothetical protein EKPJFOCH_0159 [Methylobacterium thuringiense]